MADERQKAQNKVNRLKKAYDTAEEHYRQVEKKHGSGSPEAQQALKMVATTRRRWDSAQRELDNLK